LTSARLQGILGGRMLRKNVKCPSCGAPVDVDRSAAMAVCDYCESAFYFKDEAVELRGKVGTLVETSSPLYVGATGTFRSQGFRVMGRIQYRCEGSIWEEWFLRTEPGAELWICEDELEFSLETPVENPGPIPGFEAIRPGELLQVAGEALGVDEKDVASLESVEGSLPFPLDIDRQFPYVDASGGETTVTVEYSADGPEVFRGTWIDPSEIELDNPKPDEEMADWSDA
jgi:hypothetical protein